MCGELSGPQKEAAFTSTRPQVQAPDQVPESPTPEPSPEPPVSSKVGALWGKAKVVKVMARMAVVSRVGVYSRK